MCAAESLWFWIFFCFVFWGECEKSGFFFLEGGNCSVQIQRKLNEGGREVEGVGGNPLWVWIL